MNFKHLPLNSLQWKFSSSLHQTHFPFPALYFQPARQPDALPPMPAVLISAILGSSVIWLVWRETVRQLQTSPNISNRTSRKKVKNCFIFFSAGWLGLLWSKDRSELLHYCVGAFYWNVQTVWSRTPAATYNNESDRHNHYPQWVKVSRCSEINHKKNTENTSCSIYLKIFWIYLPILSPVQY